MAEHPDCTVARGVYEALSGGDTEALKQLMTADVAHHVPGSHRYAGHYKGLDNVLRMYEERAEETGGTHTLALEHLFADGRGHVISVHRSRADRGERGIDMYGGIFFTVIGGKITDLDECVEDLDAENEFWG